MATYQYLALKSSGKECKGSLEGDSEKHIRQQLRDKALIPVEVTVIASEKSQGKTYYKKKIKHSDLALLTRQLATLIAASLPVEEALYGVSEQSERPQVKQILLGVRSKVLEGYSLADALKQYPSAFPELYCAAIKAGEQTGRLDLVLNRLADHSDKQQDMRQKIQQALIYPSLMIFVSIAIISFLLSFVVPKIIDVFNSTGQTLPELTRILIAMSNYLKNYGLYTLLLLILFLVLFLKSLHNTHVKQKFHRLLLRIPVVAYLIRTINTARYAHTFGILTSAGVPVLQAMDVASSLVSNLVMKKTILKATIAVKEGTNISKSLKKTSFFSPMTLHLIASGENSGRLEEMLERAAQNQDKEVGRLIDTGLTLFEPVIILIMGAVVLFIVLATLLPIFSMDQLVS